MPLEKRCKISSPNLLTLRYGTWSQSLIDPSFQINGGEWSSLDPVHVVKTSRNFQVHHDDAGAIKQCSVTCVALLLVPLGTRSGVHKCVCSGAMRQSPTPHPSEPLCLGMWLSFNFFGDRLHKFTKKTSASSATMSTGIFLQSSL